MEGISGGEPGDVVLVPHAGMSLMAPSTELAPGSLLVSFVAGLKHVFIGRHGLFYKAELEHPA